MAKQMPCDNAGGDGLLETHGRTDGDGDLAGAHGGAVGQGQEGNFVGTHADHGEIGVRVVADKVGGELAPVGEEYLQRLRTVDNVAVGEDVAVGRDEESRARPSRRVVAADLDVDDGRVRGRHGAGNGVGVGIDEVFIGGRGGDRREQ
jgi:hypothetical protein